MERGEGRRERGDGEGEEEVFFPSFFFRSLSLFFPFCVFAARAAPSNVGDWRKERESDCV
jgi:hypothetical protein